MLRNDDYKQRLRLVAADEAHFNANVVPLKLCKYAKKLIQKADLFNQSSFICHFVVYILQKDKIELMEARSPQETNRLLVKGTSH